jgi:putative hemolysin
MHLLINIIILVILIALSSYFSGSETALTTVSRIKMRTMSDSGDKRASLVLKVTDHREKMLSAILIGNNIVNLSASSLSTSVAMRLFGSLGAGIATFILTFLILIFGEITPKNHAQQDAVRLSLKRAPVIWMLMWVLTPIIFVINRVSAFFIMLMGQGNKAADNNITEEELKTIVDVSSENGVIEKNEQRYIHNLFDFSDSMVKEVMIPRIDMMTVNANWSYEKLISEFRKEMFTRMPVYENEKDNIIGIINVKDLLIPHEDRPFSIREYIRKPYYTYEHKKIADLFHDMRQNSVAMAIVLDEYGDAAGLVTLEDLLEELVGEIKDEYDSNEEDDIEKISDREYMVRGSMNLDDLCEILPLDFQSDDYDTIGGYLTGLFDHVPDVGETYVTNDGILLRVAATGHQRIEKVDIRFPKAPVQA